MKNPYFSWGGRGKNAKGKAKGNAKGNAKHNAKNMKRNDLDDD